MEHRVFNIEYCIFYIVLSDFLLFRVPIHDSRDTKKCKTKPISKNGKLM